MGQVGEGQLFVMAPAGLLEQMLDEMRKIRASLESSGAKAAQSDDDLLTVDQVAAFLQVHRRTVYWYRDHGLLKFKKIGGSVRFRRGDVLEMMQVRTHAKQSA